MTLRTITGHLLGSGVLAVLGACTAAGPGPNADFDRHRFSRLVQPYERPEALYFDVSYPAEYPRDDLDAEAARLQWLSTWLKSRNMCPAGYDIARRRPFDYLEDNPGRYAERWEIACKAVPAAGGAG